MRATRNPQTLTLRRYPDLEGNGQMNKTDIDVLWYFQRYAGARTVRFGAWQTGVGYAYKGGCTSAAEEVSLTADAPLGVSGIQRGAKPQYSGIWR